jgi:hypothetical protein
MPQAAAPGAYAHRQPLPSGVSSPKLTGVIASAQDAKPTHCPAGPNAPASRWPCVQGVSPIAPGPRPSHYPPVRNPDILRRGGGNTDLLAWRWKRLPHDDVGVGLSGDRGEITSLEFPTLHF